MQKRESRMTGRALSRWLIGCFIALVAAQPSIAAIGNSITQVSITKGQDDDQVIKILFKESAQGLPVAFTTSNPNRLVLDFANTTNDLGRINETVNAGVIQAYQLANAGERTRLVIQLTAAAHYELRKDHNMVFAVVRAANSSKKGPSTVAFPATAATRAHQIRAIDFKRGKDGESQIVVSLSDPGAGVDLQQKGQTIQVDFLNTGLPEKLQRRLDVTDFATPAQTVESFTQDRDTRMVIKPRGKWDYSAYQVGNQFILEVRPLDGPNAARADRPQYSGEKLSLNFQNVEVRAVLQVIADFTGLNIIASDTVSGNVTLRLKDVPWDQALEIILRAKGLDKRASGNVIWVAPRDELVTKEKIEMETRNSIANLEPLVTRNFSLNYIRADEAVSVLSGSSRSGASSGETATCSPSSTGVKADTPTGGTSTATATPSASGGAGASGASTGTRVLSNRGGASYDLTTNTMVITDTADRHAAIEVVLKSIDVPSRQVMIEARIVLADDSFGRNLGVRLGFGARGKTDKVGFLGTASSMNDSIDIITSSVTMAPNVDLPATALGTPGTFALTILPTNGSAQLSLELQALELDNRGKIISNPRVVTTNLRPAVILQGTQIPYQTVSTSGTQTSFKDAILCLLVAPQILNNDDIILNVEVTKDAQGADTTAGPAINVRRIKTQVRVSNGETAILGGVFEQTVRNDTTKVPFLGDVPILGHLFKSNLKRDEKTEMLIFLTPRLLDAKAPVVR